MIIGIKLVFGLRDPKPIVPRPAGTLRLRMRKDAAAMLYARDAGQTTEYRLRDDGDSWYPMPMGRNIKTA